MSSHIDRLPDLKIASGAATSNALFAIQAFEDAVTIALYGPAALDGGHTYIIEVTDTRDWRDQATATWYTLQIGDPIADAAPALATKARVYFDLPNVGGFRIKDATSNVAADRIWKCVKDWVSYGE